VRKVKSVLERNRIVNDNEDDERETVSTSDKNTIHFRCFLT